MYYFLNFGHEPFGITADIKDSTPVDYYRFEGLQKIFITRKSPGDPTTLYMKGDKLEVGDSKDVIYRAHILRELCLIDTLDDVGMDGAFRYFTSKKYIGQKQFSEVPPEMFDSAWKELQSRVEAHDAEVLSRVSIPRNKDHNEFLKRLAKQAGGLIDRNDIRFEQTWRLTFLEFRDLYCGSLEDGDEGRIRWKLNEFRETFPADVLSSGYEDKLRQERAAELREIHRRIDAIPMVRFRA